MSIRTALLLALAAATAACRAAPAGDPPAAPAHPAPAPAQATLRPFADEAQFEQLLAQWTTRAAAERKRQEQRLAAMAATPPPPPPPPAPVVADAAAAAAPAGTAASTEESITNVQTAGVDEGGIVKRHGDHLVVLRRGRLFTVRVGGDALQPVSMVDAYGPGMDPGGAWYDEMLVGGNTVVVVGYSYARGGTELVLFDISRDGALRYRDTWHLRSNDYYSARNYASRLVGDTLVFYAPMEINPWSLADRRFLPALRHWRAEGGRGDDHGAFRRILPATRIYRTDQDLDPFEDGLTLHTVTRCDLSAPVFDCSASAVLGPSGRVFYVSTDSVFVWTTSHDATQADRSAVFRLPLGDAAPTALKTRGTPIDQLSFLHDGSGHLNVLVSEFGSGEGMWGDESTGGALALLRVPLDSFGDGSTAAPASAYRRLPGSTDGDLQNRYVGDWLLYGRAPYRWRRDATSLPGSTAHALRYAGTGAVQALALGHGTERIEAMGGDAILVGSAGQDLQFTSVRLGARDAATSHVYVQANAAQGESRTHGFFYRGESGTQGIVGLPVVSQRRGNTMQRYLDESAAVLYLRNRDLALSRMGTLMADADRAVDDGCKASCVDWYGNARPIFIGERVFALLGYELVEGRVANERIVERRRTSFAPAAAISD